MYVAKAERYEVKKRAKGKKKKKRKWVLCRNTTNLIRWHIPDVTR